MRIIRKKFRNNGESLGLEHPYICGPVWLVWDRHTGKIVHIEGPDRMSITEQYRCRDKCRELNGLPDHDPAINAAHDMEA